MKNKENKSSKEGFFIALGCAIIGGIAAILAAPILIPITVAILFYRKLKRLTGYCGAALSNIGLLLWAPIVNQYFQDWILQGIYVRIRDALSPGYLYWAMNKLVSLINLEFKAVGPLCMTIGLLLIVYKKRFYENDKSKKITFDAGKKIHKYDLLYDYFAHVDAKCGKELYLGRDKLTKSPVYLESFMREGHFLIVGATRSGKTVYFLNPSMLCDFMNGYGVLYVDPKGDYDNLLATYKFLKSQGKADKFRVLCIDKPEISLPYNPLIHGNVTQQTGRIMRGFEFSEVFYQLQAKENLLGDLIGFKQNQIIPTFDKLLGTFKERKDKNCAGMVSNLSEVVLSDFAELLNHEVSAIDFIKAQQEGEFIYVMLNTDTYLDASRALTKFILLDLMYCANQVQTGKFSNKFFSIYLDEFGDFVVPGFESFMKKCGSAGYCLHLACQSFGDLRAKGLEDFVISNTFNHLVLRQSYPLNADLAVKLFGSYSTNKKTERHSADVATGDKSVRQVDELKVDPNLVKSLETGTAIFSNSKDLVYLSLPISDLYRMDDMKFPYVTEQEKPALEKELSDIALASKTNLENGKAFDPKQFIIKKDKNSDRQSEKHESNKPVDTVKQSEENGCPTIST